jgi:hypothetical protein
MKSGVPIVSSRQLAFHWRISRCLVLSLCLASLGLAEVSPKVQWKNQRLSVSVERASLSQVLQEVAQQTHIQTLGLDQLKRKDKMVSAQFVALPLDDALKRLLVNVNYALVRYATPPKGNPSGLVLVVEKQGGKSSNPTTSGGMRPDEEGRAAQAERPEPQTSGVQLKDERERQAGVERAGSETGGIQLEDEAAEAAQARSGRSGIQPAGDDRTR